MMKKGMMKTSRSVVQFRHQLTTTAVTEFQAEYCWFSMDLFESV
jgi:hypothetical protein